VPARELTAGGEDVLAAALPDDGREAVVHETFWKASTALAVGALKGEPGNSLKRIRLNLQRRFPKVRTSSFRVGGRVVHPAMRMYSKVMRLRLGMG